MKTFIRFALGSCLSFLVLATASAFAAESSYLVKFKPTVSDVKARDALEGRGLIVKRLIKEIQVYVAIPKDPEEFSKQLKRAGAAAVAPPDELLYAEPNYTVHAIATPNDNRYGEQYGLHRMDVERAWDISTGSRDIIVAVSDTGVDLRHWDLRNQIWQNTREIPGNHIDDDGNGFVDDVQGWDFFGNDNDPIDENGHGTHVSGILGAEGNNVDGIAGVNWRVRIMPVRFLNSQGSGSTEGGIDTLLYAVNNGARIINCSWGGSDSSRALKDAIDYAFSKGALVFAAAGNSSADADSTPEYPSAFGVPGIVSVASSYDDNALSSFSNYGRTSVDLVAPGSNILSTFPNNQWKQLSGTSMATPMASGVAALILSVAPRLSAMELRNAVLNAVVERPKYEGKISTAGDLSAYLALQQLSGGFQVWPSRITLPLDGTYQFTAYAAQGAVEWSTSDPSVASVDSSGVVTALKEGEIQVRARDASGSAASTQWVRVVKVVPKTGGGGCRGVATTGVDSGYAALNMGLPLFVGFVATRRKRKTRAQSVCGIKEG